MPEKIGDTDVTDYGEPLSFDPNFRGPIKNRSCTDIICLIIFIAFLIGWAVISVFAAYYGDPGRLLNPTDSKGQVCGRDEAVKNKPYLLFFDLTRCASPQVPFTGCPTPQICVERCPTENWFFLQGSTTDKSKLYCKDGVDKSKSISELILNQDCAAYYINSQNIVGRCIPKVEINGTVVNRDGVTVKLPDGTEISSSQILKSANLLGEFIKARKLVEGVFEDIKNLWPYMLGGCVIAMILSLTWIFLLRLVAKVMVWLSLVLFAVLSGYASYYTMDKYMKARKNIEDEKMMTASEIEFVKTFSSVSNVETTWLVFFILTVSLFIICLFILIFLRKRIQLAIALINEASKALGHMMSAVFFPLIPYLLHIILLLIFCVIAVLIASAGKPVYRVVCNGNCSCSPFPENSTCSPSKFKAPDCRENQVICQFISYDVPSFMQYFHIYNVFALIWTMFFVSAFCEYVLAGAFASYYWSFNKPEDIPSMPVIKSLWRTCRYHLGTIAFGSLIIAIVRFIRLIFEYIDHKFKKYADNIVVKILSCCCRCFLWCLEKFLKFINRNAYIYSAIYGTNFCHSARKAFSLLMRNILRVVVLDKVTDFLLLIGKLVVTGIMALISFAIFSGEVLDLRGHLPPINYYLTPVIIITVATFFIASAFFDVYNMGVDTLFYCFLEDNERNDGSVEKPYFMSKTLKKILHKQNKFDEE